jgi:hypothetical protein
MRTTAVRLGLVAAVAGVLVLGRPADATDTPAMTKKEASAFKKEIAAKLKAYEAKLKGFAAEESEFWKDFRPMPGATEVHEAFTSSLNSRREAAQREFYDGLRACLADANDPVPYRAGGEEGSTVQNAVDHANATAQKVQVPVAKAVQQSQAAAARDCQPVAVVRKQVPASFQCTPFDAAADLPNAAIASGHDIRAFITECMATGRDEVGATCVLDCRGSHATNGGCGAEGVIFRVETDAATYEVPGVPAEGEPAGEARVFSFHADAVYGNGTAGRVCRVSVRPPDAEPGLFLPDAVLVSCPVEEPEQPSCDAGKANLIHDYLLEATGDLAEGGRTVQGSATRLEAIWDGSGEFHGADLVVWADPLPAGPKVIAVYVPEELPSSGTRATCRSETYGDLEGTLVCADGEAITSPTSTRSIRGTFTATNAPVVFGFRLCQGQAPFMEPACVDEVVVTVNGSPVPVDSRTSGNRYLLANGVRMQVDYSDPATPGGNLFLFVNLLDPHPASGAVTLPVIATSPVQETGAEIYRNGYELGTLTIDNVEAYLSDQGTASIRMKFVSTDGNTVIEWCLPQSAVPF